MDFLKANFGDKAESVRPDSRRWISPKVASPYLCQIWKMMTKVWAFVAHLETFYFLPLGVVAQELFVAGGLENWISSLMMIKIYYHSRSRTISITLACFMIG